MKGTVFQPRVLQLNLDNLNRLRSDCGISVGAGGLMVWPSALHTEGCGLESRTGTYPVFFCRGICCAGVDLCCLHVSLIVTLWVGNCYFHIHKLYSVSLCIEHLIPSVFTCSGTGCMVPFPT